MTRTSPGIVAALALAITLPATANAYIDCCFIRPAGVQLRSAAIVGYRGEALLAWGEQMGFAPEFRVGERDPYVEIGDTDLVAQQVPVIPDDGAGESRIVPFPGIRYEYACGRPSHPPMERVVHAHPNGAVRVLGYFGVAPSAEPLEQALRELDVLHEVRSLGCVQADGAPSTCEWQLDRKFLSLQLDASAPGGGVRAPGTWLGLVVAVSDLRLTERALAARGTAFEDTRNEWGRALRVAPEPGGGPIVEFVLEPDRF